MAVYHLSSNAYESPKWMIKEIFFGSERENKFLTTIHVFMNPILTARLKLSKHRIIKISLKVGSMQLKTEIYIYFRLNTVSTVVRVPDLHMSLSVV